MSSCTFILTFQKLETGLQRLNLTDLLNAVERNTQTLINKIFYEQKHNLQLLYKNLHNNSLFLLFS